ncbi:MAG: MBOAT family protein [Oscillospiraceae bacterium]|jgi:D-alanyl-lipoteichoic acid acyltransferase DltB (MBOAT superfamily)|nr:MBOAT family protein [Oscillospiraceae bacterium]
MLFSSNTFLFLFLPAALAGYYLLGLTRRVWIKNAALLAASLLFYAWGEPRFVFALPACALLDWLLALGIRRSQRRGRRGALPLAAGLSLHLLLLFGYKYLGFALETLGRILPGGWPAGIPQPALPLGLSFFTFQTLSYLTDVYRGKAEALRRFGDAALYLIFFPQLVAGPIVRCGGFAPQIRRRQESWALAEEGVVRLTTGLAKKTLLADSLAVAANCAFGTDLLAGEPLSTSLAWLGLLAFSLQIYFDFSGYSDMAVGLGLLFGFRLPENFRYPYAARSVADFWRRWHRTLGAWFRDYIYIPLGGSRKGLPRTLANLLLVWLLTGLWHGANWTFLAWGLWYFLFLAAERLLGRLRKTPSGETPSPFLRSLPGRLWTLGAVGLGWVFFRADSLHHAAAYLGRLFGLGAGSLTDGLSRFLLQDLRFLLPIALTAALPILPRLGRTAWRGTPLSQTAAWRTLRPAAVVLLLLLAVSAALRGEYHPFVYFRF